MLFGGVGVVIERVERDVLKMPYFKGFYIYTNIISL